MLELLFILHSVHISELSLQVRKREQRSVCCLEPPLPASMPRIVLQLLKFIIEA